MSTAQRTVVVVGVTLFVVVIAGFVITALLFKPFSIPSPAMAPTLEPGDHVWTRSVDGDDVNRGDIVIMLPPSTRVGRPVRITKRVIALGGDTIENVDGVVVVNQEPLDEDYLAPGTRTPDFAPLDVPADHVFVLGDNRGNSEDSRIFGPVPTSKISHRVVWVDAPAPGLIFGALILLAVPLAWVIIWPFIRPSGASRLSRLQDRTP